MTKYTLYYTPACPFCARVIHEVEDFDIKIDKINTDTDSAGKSKLFSSTGMHQVPCLEVTSNIDSQWIFESKDIVDYLGTVLEIS